MMTISYLNMHIHTSDILIHSQTCDHAYTYMHTTTHKYTLEKIDFRDVKTEH